MRPSSSATLHEEREALEYVLATEGWRFTRQQWSLVVKRIYVLGGDPASVTVLPPLDPGDLADLFAEDEEL